MVYSTVRLPLVVLVKRSFRMAFAFTPFCTLEFPAAGVSPPATVILTILNTAAGTDKPFVESTMFVRTSLHTVTSRLGFSTGSGLTGTVITNGLPTHPSGFDVGVTVYTAFSGPPVSLCNVSASVPTPAPATPVIPGAYVAVHVKVDGTRFEISSCGFRLTGASEHPAARVPLAPTGCGLTGTV